MSSSKTLAHRIIICTRAMSRGRSVQLDVREAGVGRRRTSGLPGREQRRVAGRVPRWSASDDRLDRHPTTPDLYMCDVSAVTALEQDCRNHLTDLTVGYEGQHADVLGAVIGASEDLGYVYFVANGVLPTRGWRSRAPPRATAPAAFRKSSPLRRSRATCTCPHAGVVSLVAVLSNRDSPDWQAGGLQRPTWREVTSRVSPNGQWSGVHVAAAVDGL